MVIRKEDWIKKIVARECMTQWDMTAMMSFYNRYFYKGSVHPLRIWGSKTVGYSNILL